MVSNEEQHTKVLTTLLTQLDYSFSVVQAESIAIEKQLKIQNTAIVLLPVYYLSSQDGLQIALNIRSRYQVVCVFYAPIITRDCMAAVQWCTPPVYLTPMTNKDHLFVNIELARAYARNTVLKTTSWFFIRQNQDYLKLRFKDVTHVKSEHVYLRIYTTSGKEYLIRENLNRFIFQLPDYFLRCHRSYIVNFENIDTIYKKKIALESGVELPLAPSCRPDLLQFIRRAHPWIERGLSK